MVDKTSTSKIPIATVVLGAVGLGLVIWGITKAAGPSAHDITATFSFDYSGPEQNVKFRVRFGTVQVGVFSANPDLIKYSPSVHLTATGIGDVQHYDYRMKVTVPAKKAIGFPLPFTYDAEAMILDSNGDLIDDNKVVTENVFTHTADYEVVML